MSKLQFVCSLSEASIKLNEWKNSNPTGPAQFGIEIDTVLFPVFLSFSHSDSDKLVVLYNGAVSRSRCEDGIVFQRSSWSDEIPATVVSFADPTLVSHEGMTIGWGQADGKLFAPEQYKVILDMLRTVLSLPEAHKTLHYGSSAGGFQALATTAFDRDSHALCNNPQVDFSQYNLAWATNRALKVNGFKNRTEYLESENYDDISWRIEIPKLYENLYYSPENIRIQVNAASENDLKVQIAAFVSEITSISSLPSVNGYEIYYYYHPALGHNPLPKPSTITEIENELERL